MELLQAMKQLVKRNEAILENQDEIVRTIVSSLNQRPQAIIPTEEHEKLVRTIMTTRCNLPSADSFSKNLVSEIKKDVGDFVKYLVSDTIRYHLIVAIVIASFLFSLGAMLSFSYFRSDMYWGERYHKLTLSEMISEEDSEKLNRGTVIISKLPKWYFENPELGRKEIRNLEKAEKKIRKQRKKK